MLSSVVYTSIKQIVVNFSSLSQDPIYLSSILFQTLLSLFLSLLEVLHFIAELRLAHNKFIILPLIGY